ncbi:tartrate transporter (plasmid) [Azospirillum sp. B510]|uniref:MFS transporter n=1 Tax=Azospirillum sp. (strain B510) TaxID=137722 RepID=UPI0001C4C9A7|nr:MFS transporter [Azospirillum sp. B510]BAI74689.1 tartrate transporter [Azospirillum sp. B510]
MSVPSTSNPAASDYESAVASVPKSRWYRILIPVMTLCIISYIDRTNIGFAMAGGMATELAMTASFAGFAAGIFFIGYIFLQVPAGHLASRGAAKHFLTGSMIAWGVISILTAFIQNETQLVILRFILGLAEGGMLPVALTMIAQWFPNEERGRATAIMIMFVPIANIISGPLAGVIIENFGWRNLFLIEGVGTFFLILPWMLMVTEDPRKAKWISEAERAFIVSRLDAEQAAIASRPETAKASLKQAMATSEMWKLIIMNFFYQTAIYAFVIWLPTVIKTLTQTSMASTGYLSMLPYIGTMIGMYTFGRLSDRSGDRKTYVALPLLGLAGSLLFSVLLQNHIWLSFACLVLAGGFLQSAASVFWTIPPLLFPASVAGGVRGAINALGNLGGFLGPYMLGFFKDLSGSTDSGVLMLVGFLVVSAAITYTLPIKRDGTRA